MSDNRAGVVPVYGRFVRNPDLIAVDMDGETVMMSIERGEYFGLGGVGSMVWELLAQATTLEILVDRICAMHAVSQATCLADMQRFLGELLAKGLVQRA